MRINSKLLQEINGIDPFEAMLLLTSKYTLLPEILSIFGRDRALQFIEVFSGKTIKVPQHREIEKALESLVIWSELKKNRDRATLKRLCNRYNLKEAEVKAAYARVQEMINDQGKKFSEWAEEESGDHTAVEGQVGSEKFDIDEDLFGDSPDDATA